VNKKPAISKALSEIFSGIRQLKDAFPRKEFTIDGRLVGDIGLICVKKPHCSY
jgi:hypothetical protein